MRKNIARVIEAFKARCALPGKTCSTDGTTVFSYAMPIAYRAPHGCIVMVRYEECPTATTRAQWSAVHRSFSMVAYASAAEMAPGYRFRDLAGTPGYLDRHRAPPAARKPAKRAAAPVAETGYQHCACRDCMEIAIGPIGTMCTECREAGCDAFYTECRAAESA